MTIDAQANEDFQRAIRKALWRKVAAWLRREENQLVPYHVIRERIPMKGQSDLGLQSVKIEQIIGSAGRYRDFDRAFLPIQENTKDRWLSIDRAHLTDVDLPPIKLYKIGDAYFVRDGNHRVSVAREQGRLEIDAEVIEVRVPVPITADTRLEDLDLKEEYARFLGRTRLQETIPEPGIEFTIPGEYDRLYEHIDAHRWYLGERQGRPVPFEEAAVSWYGSVFTPLVEKIRELNLLQDFPNRKEADLYLWISEYQWYRREAFKLDSPPEAAGSSFIEDHDYWPAKKIVRVLRDAAWVDWMILSTEREAFETRTQIQAVRPHADINLTVPGKYEQLMEHIEVHRWYLGEEQDKEIDLLEAVASWHDNVYRPLIEVIREEMILDDFPGRSETDLYLWIMANRATLIQEGDPAEI